MRFKLIMALVDDHHGEYSERRSESRRHGRDGRHERPRRRYHTGENIPWARDRRASRPYDVSPRQTNEPGNFGGYCESRRVRPKIWERHRIPNCDLRF